MITWMQKHKKWLIVTIWISTIAFVGAGFVGWGSYDYGKSNSTVAIVGDKEVPLTDLQNEYSALYSQYQQMFGTSFNKELAQQLKLEDVALQKTIQKYLLMNYASELGLKTTDEEVAKEIVKINSFFKDGKFDKQTYITVLKQNRRTATEFEGQLKQDLLVSKLQKIFNLPLTSNEIGNIGQLLYSQDRVSISIIDTKNINIKPTNTQLKEYWEKVKSDYKSPVGYSVSYTKVDNVDNKTKKEMKRVALKLYLKLKKDEVKFETTETIYNSSSFLSSENFDKVINSNIGDTLKPIYENKNYYVVKLVKKVDPEVLPYNEVKAQIKTAYIEDEKNKILDKKAKNLISNFKGKDIGYISRDKKATIVGLADEETEQLTKKIFNSTKRLDSVKLFDKVVVFKITDSKFIPYDKSNDNSVVSTMGDMKTNLIVSTLLEKLQNKYEVKSFMGTK